MSKSYKKGDIVLVNFPFTDLKGLKFRPALVVAVYSQDITLAFVTSQLTQRDPHDVEVQATKHNRLKANSLVRTAKLVTLDVSLVTGYISTLSVEELAAVNVGLSKALGL